MREAGVLIRKSTFLPFLSSSLFFFLFLLFFFSRFSSEFFLWPQILEAVNGINERQGKSRERERNRGRRRGLFFLLLFHGGMEKPPVKYVTRRNIGFESSRAHSRVRECVASLTKRKGWLRTSEWAETRNGMSYPLWELSAFILSLPPRPNHRHAIFVPRCKSFYKVFIPILFPNLRGNRIFFSFSPPPFPFSLSYKYLRLWQIFQLFDVYQVLKDIHSSIVELNRLGDGDRNGIESNCVRQWCVTFFKMMIFGFFELVM